MTQAVRPYPCTMQRMMRLLLVLALMAFAQATVAQEGMSKRKQEKALAKKEKVEAKEMRKRDREGRKRHMGLQDKKTRKRIKRNTKRADRRGTNRHEDGFFRRLFGG